MVEGNEDSFCVLLLLESTHSLEPCIEVTDVGFQPVRCGRNPGVHEMRKGMAASFLETS